MYAPWRMFRKWLSRKIYYWADNRYGVKARGPVKGFKMLHHPVLGEYGISDFTDKQQKMVIKWHFWMRVKNKIYDVAKPSLAERIHRHLTTLLDNEV